MPLHLPDVGIGDLELISAAPGGTGGGIGSVLYGYVREECLLRKVKGLFLNVAPTIQRRLATSRLKTRGLVLQSDIARPDPALSLRRCSKWLEVTMKGTRLARVFGCKPSRLIGILSLSDT